MHSIMQYSQVAMCVCPYQRIKKNNHNFLK